MNHLKKIAKSALAATALSAMLGVSSASATAVEIGGVTKNESVTFTLSIKSGTSAVLKDTFGFSTNTCTASHKHGNLITFFGIYIILSYTPGEGGLSFSKCEREPVTVHKSGNLKIEHISSSTNGTAVSSETEFTTGSPFGTLNCKTGAGTHLGTLTGVASGHATLDVNAVFSCSGISSRFEATYTVTTPTGLGIVA
jgi:hypothetical protein